MKYLFGVICQLLISQFGFAQFAPQVGVAGTTAIYKDSNVFVNWATNCSINRGWQNIADTSLGKAQVGDETYVPGKAGNGVVSLGDGGIAIVTFEHPIMNKEGYDFAVFENGFTDQTLAPGTAFLELAFVEVSSDGVHYTRFPAASLSDTVSQTGAFQGMFAQKINNLAGKYLTNYGTPFDLEELKNSPHLDVNNITHVKIIDVVGSLDSKYGNKDAQGNKINDPWPTPFASSGFDLDAVGVIHQDINLSIAPVLSNQTLSLFPNPLQSHAALHIRYPSVANLHISLYDVLGNQIEPIIHHHSLDESSITLNQSGIFQLVITDGTHVTNNRIIVQ